MGKPWSEKRHLAVALKRIQAIKEGRATTVFFMGPIAEFKHEGKLYQFCLLPEGLELEVSKGTKTLWTKKLSKKAFNDFIVRTTDWLRFPKGFVVYKKKEE